MESRNAIQAAGTEEFDQMSGKYLTFRLGDEEYGLEILRVREIIGLMEITAVPGTPSSVRGVINLRGKVIPVLDLRVKFGMERIQDSDQTCIIVAEIAKGGRSVENGILVDAVSEVLDIEADDIEETPSFGSSVNTGFIQGMARTGDRVTILLNVQNVVDKNEINESSEAAVELNGGERADCNDKQEECLENVV